MHTTATPMPLPQCTTLHTTATLPHCTLLPHSHLQMVSSLLTSNRSSCAAHSRSRDFQSPTGTGGQHMGTRGQYTGTGSQHTGTSGQCTGTGGQHTGTRGEYTGTDGQHTGDRSQYEPTRSQFAVISKPIRRQCAVDLQTTYSQYTVNTRSVHSQFAVALRYLFGVGENFQLEQSRRARQAHKLVQISQAFHTTTLQQQLRSRCAALCTSTQPGTVQHSAL